MTVTTTQSSRSLVGDGANLDFPMAFPFLDDGDITVTVDDVEQVLDTDYTLTGAGVIDAFGVRTNGTVTFLVGSTPDNGAAVYIERNTSRLQNTALRSSGQFLPATHEEMFDRSMMIHQEDDRRLAALESLGDLVTVTDLAAGVQVVYNFTTDADEVETTFPFDVPVAGGDSALHFINKVQTYGSPGGDDEEADPFISPPVVQWGPSIGDFITIKAISGLRPGRNYTIIGLVLFA